MKKRQLPNQLNQQRYLSDRKAEGGFVADAERDFGANEIIMLKPPKTCDVLCSNHVARRDSFNKQSLIHVICKKEYIIVAVDGDSHLRPIAVSEFGAQEATGPACERPSTRTEYEFHDEAV
jgi:hypothetical protein